jgi:hypothetical protein
MALRLPAAAITAAALVAPSAAQAATLGVDRGCYGPGEPVIFTGTQYTPNGDVALTTNGRQVGTVTANNVGVFQARLSAPTLGAGERVDPFTGTDLSNQTNTGSTNVRVTALSVRVSPRSGNPARVRRIKARGFTRSRNLYAHVRGRSKRNIRIGKLKAPCGRLSKKKRIFRRGTKPGSYTVQMDGSRKYRSTTTPRVTFNVTVFRVFRSGSAGAATLGERWERVP